MAQVVFWTMAVFNLVAIVFITTQVYKIRMNTQEQLDISREMFKLSNLVNKDTREKMLQVPERVAQKVEEKVDEIKSELFRGK